MVIAIIAILAAILFPVFARAKAAAKKTVCLSNLNQIGKAIVIYMGDYDDVFPNAIDASDKYAPQIWDAHPDFQARIPYMPLMSEVLQPYLKNHDIFHCPSDDGTFVLENNFPNPFLTKPSMYKVYESSYFFRTEIAFRAFTQTAFQLPTDVNVFFDGAGHWHVPERALQPADDFGAYVSLVRQYRYNVLFGDFHAKSITNDQLQTAWNTQL